MDNTKFILASKTVWGGIVAFVGATAPLWSKYIAPADMQSGIDAGGQVMAGLGSLVAVVGRVLATTALTITTTK